MGYSISVHALFDLLKSKKGWEKPGHKYLYRVPLPAGGYRYYYKHATPKGSKQDEEPDYRDFTDNESAKFDKDQDFVSEQDKAVTEFLNFRRPKNEAIIKNYVKEIDSNFTAFYGRTWEIFAALPDVKNFNDSIMKIRYYVDNFKDEHHQKILNDLVNRVSALKDSKNSYHLDRLVGDNQTMWGYFKKASKLAYKIDFQNLRVMSTAHIQRKDIVSDLHIIDISKTGQDKNNDLGLFMMDLNTGIPNAIGISSKAFKGTSPINLKNNSASRGIELLQEAATRLHASGHTKSAHVMREWAAKMKRSFDNAKGEAHTISNNYKDHKADQLRINHLKKQGAATFQKWVKKKTPEFATMTPEQQQIYSDYRELTKKIFHAQNTWRTLKLKDTYFKAFQDSEFNKAFTEELYDVYSGAFHDSSVSEMMMIMPYYDDKSKVSELFIVRESKLKKELKRLLEPGNFSYEMRETDKKQVMGKEIQGYSDIDIHVNLGGKRVKMGTLRFRADEAKIYTQMDPNFMLNFVRKNNEPDGLDKQLSKMGYAEGVKKSVDEDLLKAIETTERKRMNAKYIRKELTESGKVRYIYREVNPRGDRELENEPVRRNNFTSAVDSVDPEYKSLFDEACQEIDDENFISINAGTSAVRFSGDIEVMHDVVGVPQELREQFADSAGLFNPVNGVMGFCTSNFPAGISEMMKKGAMMHEVGHGFFYGTIRIKEKKPLTTNAIDLKDKEQKAATKDAVKFVDTFGKMDAELRKKAEFDVAEVKGRDKEELLQESIKTYMVSEYATLSSEEHFAEAFSRYFMMPEQLKKKEKEVYEHFEAYFQKYGG